VTGKKSPSLRAARDSDALAPDCHRHLLVDLVVVVVVDVDLDGTATATAT
jgi:hypothetical protein